MKPVAHAYYAKFSDRYLSEVKKLVPKYDEMTGLIVDLIRKNSPACLLDIGPGIGQLDHLILTDLPEARITAVEASREMHRMAGRTLDPHVGRVRLFHQDILEFEPSEKYDAIFSNLVLHNVPYEDKEALFEKLHAWLEPDGIFIWGDMIRYRDPQIQEHFVQFRLKLALERGVKKGFAQENFEKERHHDCPLTIEESLQLGRKAGFSSVETIWIHDTFSIFFLRRLAQ